MASIRRENRVYDSGNTVVTICKTSPRMTDWIFGPQIEFV
jgi:hypothetical protein